MKPPPLRNMTDSQHAFDYRLSRARRVMENAFGITANRFRCLMTTMPQQPDRVTTIALSCRVLHNLLRLRKPNADLSVDKDTQTPMNLCPASGETTPNFPHGGNSRRYTIYAIRRRRLAWIPIRECLQGTLHVLSAAAASSSSASFVAGGSLIREPAH